MGSSCISDEGGDIVPRDLKKDVSEDMGAVGFQRFPFVIVSLVVWALSH